MNKYRVSVWNMEKVYAKSEAEAVARIKKEFYGDWYDARDFEYDDAELVEEELTDEDLVEWNLYKSNAPYPNQTVHCEASDEFSEDGDGYLVTTICSVLVEAEDEEEAEENARDCFYYINKDNFEIHRSI